MKIDIFSGFLGSGKTTLIKKLLKDGYQNEKVVLIENEFGEIGIDGGFLKEAGIEITEMNSGCICCSLVGDFAKALKEVSERFSPDRIIIEPSGVGKLSDVEKAVKNGLPNIEINTKTTVINVKKCLMYAKNFGEFFLDQLQNADCIVLSHTDTASTDKINESHAFIKKHNPCATIITTPISELDGNTILASMEKRTHSVKQMAEELLAEHEHTREHDEDCHCHEHHDEDCHCHERHDEDCHCHEHTHKHEHDEHCHCHEHGHNADEVFVSIGKETTNLYTANELREMLNALNDEHFGMVLRAKGIVQSYGKWLHFDYIPDGIDVREGCPDIIGKICVIGSNLNEKALCDLFKLN